VPRGEGRDDRRGGTSERRDGYRDRRDDRQDGYAPRGDRRNDRPGDRGPRRDGEGYRDRQNERKPWEDRRDGGPRRDGGRGDQRGGHAPRREDRRDEGRGGHTPRGDRRDDRRDDLRQGFPDRGDGHRGRRDESADFSTHRHRAPEIDEDITGRELDKPTRAQLGALEPRNAEAVGKHLVMAGRYLLDDPELALEHAKAAGRRGGRIAAVREATGTAAYEAGDYSLALKELRTFRRMTGAEIHLPLMVDCERALGRVDKAMELAASSAAESLEPSEKVELAIVLAGMRRDQGDAQGVVDALSIPQLDKNRGFPYSPRLFRAYAEALRGVGRAQEALTWDRQAVVAEAALGTGQFAEPEIFDFDEDDEPEQPPAHGVDLAAEPAEPAGGTAGESGTPTAEPSRSRRGSDSRTDGDEDEQSDDALDEGLDAPEKDADPDDDPQGGSDPDPDPDDAGADDAGPDDADPEGDLGPEADLDPDDDFQGGSESDLDPDDDADLIGTDDAVDGGAERG
jgi:hypothetical protein